MISERVLDVKEDMCLCFIDFQKAFDRAHWSRLLELLEILGLIGGTLTYW